MSLPHAAVRRPSRWPAVLSLLAGLAYGVSPIDLIPDLIPVLGWSDDAGVMLTAICIAWRFLHRRRRFHRLPIPLHRGE